MARDTSVDFVGCDRIVAQQDETLAMFRAAERNRDWIRIHRAHYDWWMFPIDQPSSYGFAYTVAGDEIEELRGVPGYLAAYREGVRILLLSWGWDAGACAAVEDPDPAQCWQGWPIRLEKCGRSLWLFGERDLYHASRAYAVSLIDAGVPMAYRGRDCGDFFRGHV